MAGVQRFWVTSKRKSTGGDLAAVHSGKSDKSFGAVQWLKLNVFNGWANSLVSLVILAFAAIILAKFISWAVLNSVWNANSFEECQEIVAAAHGENARGACWAVVRYILFRLLLVGFYLPELYWRLVAALLLFFVALAPVGFRSLPRQMLWFTVFYPFVAYYLIRGGFGLEFVEAGHIGGLMLSLILAMVGSVLAIPVGITLALGRKFLILPFRVLCAGIIVFLRGMPLIFMLFSGITLANLYLPPGANVDATTFVIVIIALHTGCRIGAAIHEELATIPLGQWEAARALGFSHGKAIWLIMLPQVLRNLSPWFVLASVGAFRDTTIVGLIGLFEPYRYLVVIRSQSSWQLAFWETFLFFCFIYWIISFCMTLYSRYLERKLSDERRYPVNLSQQPEKQAIVTDSTA